MKYFSAIILVICTTIVCSAQTRKVVYGSRDTTYYSIKHDTIDGEPRLKYKLKEPLPDAKWMVYDSKDTMRLVDEITYKNKKKNGLSIHYSYIQQTNELAVIANKTEELYIDNAVIKWTATHYNSGIKTCTDFYSAVTKKHACKEKKPGYEFPILSRRDSVICFNKYGNPSQKGYFNTCGRQEGEWTSWTIGGELEKREIYKDGKLIRSIGH